MYFLIPSRMPASGTCPWRIVNSCPFVGDSGRYKKPNVIDEYFRFNDFRDLSGLENYGLKSLACEDSAALHVYFKRARTYPVACLNQFRSCYPG